MEFNAAIALKAKPFLRGLIFSISPQQHATIHQWKSFTRISFTLLSQRVDGSEISSFSARFTLQAIHCDNTRVFVYSGVVDEEKVLGSGTGVAAGLVLFSYANDRRRRREHGHDEGWCFVFSGMVVVLFAAAEEEMKIGGNVRSGVIKRHRCWKW